MKRMFVLAGLLAVVAGLAFAQQQDTAYHLVVIDRAKCPGEIVQVAEVLASLPHGRTGYYIVLGKGAVTIPANATVIVNLASQDRTVIANYLNTSAFQRFVSQPGILESFKFALQQYGK